MVNFYMLLQILVLVKLLLKEEFWLEFQTQFAHVQLVHLAVVVPQLVYGLKLT
jgi:hypothetical protein